MRMRLKGEAMAKKKAGTNTRVEGTKSDQRIPFTMTQDELKDFDNARAKKYPLATRSTVIRELIANFVKETK
jgi:hypothetical protein